MRTDDKVVKSQVLSVDPRLNFLGEKNKTEILWYKINMYA